MASKFKSLADAERDVRAAEARGADLDQEINALARRMEGDDGGGPAAVDQEKPPTQVARAQPAVASTPAAQPAAQPKRAPKKGPAKLPTDCPFILPSREKRLKVFLWGASGVGKTCLALQFPAPAVIDAERGTEPYRDRYDFHVFQSTVADEIMQTVEWLDSSRHPFRTLVVDPVTLYWEALQRKWSDIFMLRKQDSKGFKIEFYDLSFKDWSTIKAEYKEFIRRLLRLDMNVVVTAHTKGLFAGDGDSIRKIGETFDSEKKTEYAFDIVLELKNNVHLAKGHADKYTTIVHKDRYGRLPANEFRTRYEMFASTFGEDTLGREAVPFDQATETQVRAILDLADELRIPHAKVMSRIRSYGATDWDELSRESADVILAKLQTAAEKSR